MSGWEKVLRENSNNKPFVSMVQGRAGRGGAGRGGAGRGGAGRGGAGRGGAGRGGAGQGRAELQQTVQFGFWQAKNGDTFERHLKVSESDRVQMMGGTQVLSVHHSDAE